MFKKKTSKHPSLPIPGTSKDPGGIGGRENEPKKPRYSWIKRFCNYIYNREKKLFCGRSCKSWFYITIYSIMYLVFLSTYTLIFLFGSLTLVKYMDDYQMIDKVELLTYSSEGIGLSATPTSLNTFPIISYKNDPEDYRKYVNALEGFLSKRKKRNVDNDIDLGPCGVSPFGYGTSPCVIIRINKQLKWSAKPLDHTLAHKLKVPKLVQDWLQSAKKLWLHCQGIHSYDKEHIGNITYYPYPPGFDPEIFPIDKNSETPLIAVQFSNFTIGLSLAIECKLWYYEGVSSIEFMLYVTKKKNVS